MPLYTFHFKNGTKASYIADGYFPKEIDKDLSPYSAVFASVMDGVEEVGQINQNELLFLHIDKRVASLTIDLNNQTVLLLTQDNNGKLIVERSLKQNVES